MTHIIRDIPSLLLPETLHSALPPELLAHRDYCTYTYLM